MTFDPAQAAEEARVRHEKGMEDSERVAKRALADAERSVDQAAGDIVLAVTFIVEESRKDPDLPLDEQQRRAEVALADLTPIRDLVMGNSSTSATTPASTPTPAPAPKHATTVAAAPMPTTPASGAAPAAPAPSPGVARPEGWAKRYLKGAFKPPTSNQS